MTEALDRQFKKGLWKRQGGINGHEDNFIHKKKYSVQS